MEHQDATKDEQLERMRKKYKLGQSGRSSLSYNPVNMEYEKTPQGDKMRQLEELKSRRSLHRGLHIERNGGPIHNPING